MVSRIEPDRYADTGFAVKNTAPEINAMIFAAMMRKTPEERLLILEIEMEPRMNTDSHG